MKRHFFLFLFIAVIVGVATGTSFAQKTGKWGKKGKKIDFPTPSKSPPKELFMEVEIKGGGTFQETGATTTWSVNRKYSGRLDLNTFFTMPFIPGTAEPGTASEIALRNLDAAVQANPGSAYNSVWSASFDQKNLTFDVNVLIDDKIETVWKAKKKDGFEETITETETWKTNKVGKGVKYAQVTLNRQLRVFKVLMSLDSSAEGIKTYSRTGEDDLAIPFNAFGLPYVPDYLQNEVNIPLSEAPRNDKEASFKKTFTGFPQTPLLSKLEQSKNCTVTVTYKFKNKETQEKTKQR